jgi:CubicO group peptidase (beta-lactamase class C family)
MTTGLVPATPPVGVPRQDARRASRSASALRAVVPALVARAAGPGVAAHAQSAGAPPAARASRPPDARRDARRDAARPLRRVDRPPASAAVLDTALPRIMREAKVVGLSIAVVNGDTTAYERVFGLRDREAGVPADAGTVFEAASLTKPLFAYLVLALARDGVLDLDAPLARYLAYPDIAHDPRHRQVTARMVLSHSSGLSGGRQGARVNFVYDPGRYFNYSAEGIFYLQLVVERLLGRPLDVAMRERVFAPLGMAHSTMVWTPAAERNHATGYDYHDQRAEKWKPDKPGAAASLHTTAGDYARFLGEMMTGARLGPRWTAEMLRPQVPVIPGDSTLAWSLGFGVDRTGAAPAYYQWGSNLGVQNLVVFHPAQRVGVVYFANSEHGLQIKDDVVALAVGGRYSTDKFLTYDQYNSLTRALVAAYDARGLDAALALYAERRRRDPGHMSPRWLDELAAHAAGAGRAQGVQDAARVLALNATYYPAAWQTHVALADAYAKLGDRRRAAAAVLEAVRHCPTPELLIEPLRQLAVKWR